MSSRHAIVSLALLLGVGCSQSEPVKSPREQPSREQEQPPVVAERGQAPSNADCVAVFSFDSGGSVLDEQRSRPGAKRWDDFAGVYAAATVDPATHHPVEAVAGFRAGDAPLMWFVPDYGEAVVDAALLSSLKVAGATELRVGDREVIGSLTERGRADLSGRELVEFLMRAEVIGTYIHIGSTVCLRSETDDGQVYRAEFSGVHEYYTNAENHDLFGFAFELGADGEFAIVGIPGREFSTLVSG